MINTSIETKAVRAIVGSYDMNRILRDNEIKDEDKVKLVDLWTEYHSVKKEMETLRTLISALRVNDSLPY